MPTPRPEYPRPRFRRPDWLCLNGEWEFAFDDADAGTSEQWGDGRVLPARITVPFAYQSPLSGIGEPAIHEVVWYARSFGVPTEWAGRRVLLHFGAVDYHTTLWVNGREVGEHRGGHVPFTFDVTPYLRADENRLTVRVEDRQDVRQPRGKQAAGGQPHGIDYYCTTGIWQTVWLEPVVPVRIDDLVVTTLPDLSGLRISVRAFGPAGDRVTDLELWDGAECVCRAEAPLALSAADAVLCPPAPQPWSPATPHLYDLRVTLREGDQVLDQVHSYAGLRVVSIREGRLLLNYEPLYLKMVLDQGYWPDGLLTAPTDEALRADVEWCLRLGFNGARKHQKVEDPRWLYWCDHLGLVVWGEMANSRGWSRLAEEQLRTEWHAAVRRDRSHPCVLVWVPVNESWGFPNLKEAHAEQIAALSRLVTDTQALDPTRPVVDNDGWEHTDATDLGTIHDYSHTGDRLRDRYREYEAGGALPVVAGTRPIYLPGVPARRRPLLLTECGGFLETPDLPREQWDRLYNAYACFRTPAELEAKYRDLMAAIAAQPFWQGFCYTQLTDIEQEKNGLLDYHRSPKVEPERIAAIHRELFGP